MQYYHSRGRWSSVQVSIILTKTTIKIMASHVLLLSPTAGVKVMLLLFFPPSVMTVEAEEKISLI
jgi:hypothetical protein